jgi:hypothetical protein
LPEPLERPAEDTWCSPWDWNSVRARLQVGISRLGLVEESDWRQDITGGGRERAEKTEKTERSEKSEWGAGTYHLFVLSIFSVFYFTLLPTRQLPLV